MLYIFFKSKFEHNICFIEDHWFEIRKVDISSFNMVFDSSSGANEKIDSSLQMIGLVRDTRSSIYCYDSELIITVFHFGELSSDLDRQFSSWGQDNWLNSSCPKQFVFSEILNRWKSKSKSFSRACEISCDKILSFVDWVEAMLLDWK